MEPTRYRSTGHRPKTPQSQAEDVVFSAASSPSLTSVTPPVNVSRSPSRYRRRGAATTSASTSDLSTHPVPDIPPDLKASQASMMPGLRQQFREHPRARGRIAETPHQRPRTGSERSLSGEKSRTVVASKSWPLQHDDTKTRHVSNEKGVRGDITSVSPAERDSLARRFGRLRKRRNDETTLPRPKTGTEEPTRTASSESRSSEEGLYSFIKAGGGGAVPGTDAPKSAVNAGNRYVVVECGRASVSLPVTPSTTVSDLIKAASNYLSESIDPHSSVLLESFSKVGVQRPLRKYEHIRDVMNSWDNDTQNELVLVNSATGGKDKALYANGVPAQKPSGYSNWLYYSQRVGKWDKRWITIREDGQVTLSKNNNSADAINICHLSDFDIYSPMPKQISKKIRPPRKICFAIKSQQKLAFFASSEDFVQFFCTSDKDVATEFYTTTQRWRSWYLLHIMGEGQRNSRPTTSSRRDDSGRPWPEASRRPNSSRANHLLRRNSMTQDGKGLDTRTMYNRMMSLRTKAPPPVSFPGYVPQQPDASTSGKSGSGVSPVDSVDASLDSAFAPSGLLGYQYSVKQKNQREEEAKESKLQAQAARDQQLKLQQQQQQQQQCTQRLKNDNDKSVPRRSNSVNSITCRAQTGAGSGGNSNFRRNQSVKQSVAKPLVDLTPPQHEPPQHQRKGHGFVPEQVGPGGLIDSATSPGDAIVIPPSTDWRTRNNAVNGNMDNINKVNGSSNGIASIKGAVADTIIQQDPKPKLPKLPLSTTQTSANHNESISTPANTLTPPLKSAKRSNSVRTPQKSTHDRSIHINSVSPDVPPLPAVSSDFRGDPPTTNNSDINSTALFNAKVPFVESSLLASTAPGQGDAVTGKGVMTGANAKGPMLDLSKESEFAAGSLLAGVDKGTHGSRG